MFYIIWLLSILVNQIHFNNTILVIAYSPNNNIPIQVKNYNDSFDYYLTVAIPAQKKIQLEQERLEKERIATQKLAQEQLKIAQGKAIQIELQRVQAEQTQVAVVQTRIVMTTAPTGGLKEYAYNRICEVFGCDHWESFDFIVTKESTWNPNARNAYSGACGLGQALPCSKMASYGADYATNGSIQINWTIDYIKSRYGTPNGAKAFWNSHHWY